MKVKHLRFTFLVLLIWSVAVSCGTTPAAPPAEVTPESPVTQPPEPAPVVPVDPDNAPPDQAALDNLAAASKRAEEARKMIEDFKGSVNFPDDWSQAEALYDQAQSGNKTGTVGEVRDSIARYNAAADAYEAMTEKTVARYAQDLEDEITAARNEALAAGAEYTAPDYLLDIDNSVADALALYESKDYYNARDSGIILRDRYKLLALGVEAYKTRENALAAGADHLAPEYLGEIDTIAMNALGLYESKDYDNARNSGVQARDMYKILVVGVEAYKVRLEIEERDFLRYDPLYIADTDAIALSAQADYDAGDIATVASKADDVALDARANVAGRQGLDIANGIFNQGAASFQGRDFDQSANFYTQSRAMFIIVTDIARERRRIAEEALHEAERRVVASDEIAQRAEFILEGIMR